MLIIDVHHHYSDVQRYPAYAPDFPARLIQAMDRNGWAWTLLNGLGEKWHNRGNCEVFQAVARYPDRLAAIGYVDVDRDPPARVDELKQQGARGLKIIGTLLRYDHDTYLPFYERAAAHALPILFHTGFLGGDLAAMPRDESSDRYRPMTLDRIARLFPELPLIAAHLGTLTWYQEALAVMNHPNVYGDTSGGPGDAPATFYRLPLNDRIPWDKMLFGTDSLPDDGPIPFQNLSRLLDELAIPTETKQLIFGGNAARIFQLPVETAVPRAAKQEQE